MKKIVFLVSGNGGTLIFINEIVSFLNLPIKIVSVISDRSCNALDYAKKNNILSYQIEYNRQNNTELKNILLEVSPDIIITNIHKIIDNEIVDLFQSKLINLHYSILPSFSGFIGMKTVEAAKKRNSKFIGATVHQVDEIVDHGNILAQSCFPVDWDKTPLIEDTLFRSACLSLLNVLLLNYNFNKEETTMKLNEIRVSFSPPLCFDISNINEKFWKQIKELT